MKSIAFTRFHLTVSTGDKTDIRNGEFFMRIALQAHNCGRFISRGHGRHVTRTITSWELIFILRSKLEMFVGSDNFDVPAGDCLLLPPGVRHGGRSGYTSDLSFFWIHFLPADRKSEQYLLKRPRMSRVGNPARLSEYFQQFLSLQEDVPEDRDGLDMLMALILHEAFRKTRENTVQQELPALMQELRKTLSLRFREPLSTSQLARELQCNPDYLGRLHHRYFNESITDTLNRIRITHAAERLRSSAQGIAQIADEVGFNDPAYFRRRFFQCYAMSPRAYRRLKTQEYVNTE